MLDKNINHSPHVVLLGAGASLASFKDGDANGKVLPLMNNLVKVIKLDKYLNQNGIEYDGENFETLYNDLAENKKYGNIIKKIEESIFDYFHGLRIPNEPTIYDYLILSLRQKDLIATFNWDPLLLQAYARNSLIKRLPNLVFLHGNVGQGVCIKDKTLGHLGNRCSKCGLHFEPTKLLYPINKKNYSSDPVIKEQWDILKRHLKYAYMFTIFGYSTPISDIDAKELMLSVWKDNKTLELAEVEIIDIKSRREIERAWKDFTIRQHYQIHDDFFGSYLSKFPRRSCDAFAECTLMCKPWHENRFPKFKTIQEMHEWIKPLLIDEEKYEKDKSRFTYKAE